MKFMQMILACLTALAVVTVSGCGETPGESAVVKEQERGVRLGGPPSLREAAEAARGLGEDIRVKSVDRYGDVVEVTVATPEGGLEGPSTSDMNYMVPVLFQAIYGKARFKGNAIVHFTGGLVDTKTGQDLDYLPTGTYSMRRIEARKIDWSDEDTVNYVIDWSLYRTQLHSAVKNDD